MPSGSSLAVKGRREARRCEREESAAGVSRRVMEEFGMGWAETRVVQRVREVEEIWIVGSEVRCLINVDFPVPEEPMTAMVKRLLGLERGVGCG